jgi:hypothetical protein
VTPEAIGGVGRSYAIYRLIRFAVHGPIWHPIVSVVLIAAIVASSVLRSRRRGGRRGPWW